MVHLPPQAADDRYVLHISWKTANGPRWPIPVACGFTLAPPSANPLQSGIVSCISRRGPRKVVVKDPPEILREIFGMGAVPNQCRGQDAIRRTDGMNGFV